MTLFIMFKRIHNLGVLVFRDCPKIIVPKCAGFWFVFKARGVRITSYVNDEQRRRRAKRQAGGYNYFWVVP